MRMVSIWQNNNFLAAISEYGLFSFARFLVLTKRKADSGDNLFFIIESI